MRVHARGAPAHTLLHPLLRQDVVVQAQLEGGGSTPALVRVAAPTEEAASAAATSIVAAAAAKEEAAAYDPAIGPKAAPW